MNRMWRDVGEDEITIGVESEGKVFSQELDGRPLDGNKLWSVAYRRARSAVSSLSVGQIVELDLLPGIRQPPHPRNSSHERHWLYCTPCFPVCTIRYKSRHTSRSARAVTRYSSAPYQRRCEWKQRVITATERDVRMSSLTRSDNGFQSGAGNESRSAGELFCLSGGTYVVTAQLQPEHYTIQAAGYLQAREISGDFCYGSQTNYAASRS
ncbi:hypothetical protein BaRGS_00024800 [Batillaria attramentaria]|uniref:Uncharacterized protein n=1 Tax=Batillaria attramentaria TaxID=370345 RepID=A0ABD0K9W6_9CAEN